jgi:hypothetical protein
MQQQPPLSSHQQHSTKRIKKRRRRRHQEEQSKIWAVCLILSSFALLFTLWVFTMMYYILPMMMFENNDAIDDNGGTVSSSSSSVQSALFHNERQPPSNNTTTTIHQKQKQPPQSKLLSRNPNIIITSSTRGNLGPPTVLNQDPPGKDWLKDRWQAASDMHGTAIKGSHWVLMDFSHFLAEDRDVGGKDGSEGRAIQMTKIVLDWETAFATDYRIEGRMDPPSSSSSSSLQQDEWCVLYDGGGSGGGGKPNNNNNRHEKELQYGIKFHETEYGQSPGVKQKLPLHIIHTIEWTASSPSSSLTLKNKKNGQGNNESHLRGGGIGRSCQTTTVFRYLRIFIRKSARGWGVSLWEVDVYGTIV